MANCFRPKPGPPTAPIGGKILPPPSWPESDLTPVELITFYPCPADGTLPATLTAGTTLHQAGYTPCYRTDKPTTFSLTHLMGQLRVHICVEDEADQQYPPDNAKIELCGSGTADYPHLRLLPTGEASSLALGTFVTEFVGTEGGQQWVTEQTFVIIPQTLRQGEPCLTFTAGSNSYVFIPPKDVPLLQGKLNHLTLGIATKPGGSQEVQFLEVQSVSIGDWSEGGDLGNGEATRWK